jgi:uncharacterized protein YndB with AHSA1/START domain
MPPRVAAMLLVGLVAACRGTEPDTAVAPPLAANAVETTMQDTTDGEHDLVLTRTFAAPRARVFAALTQPDQLVHWFGATGFTLATCDVDLRVGGRVRYVFQRDSGRRIEVRGELTAVDPPRGFSYRESYDFSPLVVQVRTALADANGATTLRQVLTYATTAERTADAPGVISSSREAWERLDRHLACRGD